MSNTLYQASVPQFLRMLGNLKAILEKAAAHAAAKKIDEAALLQAVRSGHVAAAGLDSFAVEPMTAGHPFHGESNITLSPHIGGVTGDAYINMGVGAAQNVLAVLRGLQQAA